MTANVVARLAGIYGGGSFPFGFLEVVNTANNVPTTYDFPVQAAVNAAGSLINPATEDSLAAVKTAVQGTLTVSWANQTLTANLGTLNGAATAANQTAANTTLASILTTLQTARVETTWTDDSGAYYVRVDNGGTISWMTPAGAVSAAPGTGIRPAAGTSITTDKTAYQAIAAGTGYASGDFLSHYVTLDPSTGAQIGSFWLNGTQGTTIAAPASANISPSSPLPANAATAPNQVLQTASLGSPTDSAWSAGAGSLVAIGKAIVGALLGTLKSAITSNAPRASATGALTNSGDAVTLAVDGMAAIGFQLGAGSWAGTIAIFGSMDGGATYPISVAMVPWAGGASQTTFTGAGQWECACGGLTHIKVQATTAITSGSAAVVVSATNGLKSIRVGAPSTNPVPVTATALPLPAGAATASLQPALNADGGALAHITNLPTTQAVSAAALPLPTGAATDATLAAIKAAIQAQVDLATSIWTDGTNFYVRRESVNEATGAITVSLTNPDGTPSATALGGLKPVASDNSLALVQTLFDVTTAGTGTAVGDVLARVVVINKAVTPPSASSAVWLNLTQGTTLGTAPSSSVIVEQTQHLAVANFPATQPVSATALPLPNGAAADGVDASGVTMPAGGGGIRGWLSGIYAKLSGTLAVSAAALPLPAGAATSANQATEITALALLHTDLTSTPTVAPARGAATDYSKTSPATSASGVLIPASATRLGWTMQAPQTADVWLNSAGGTAGVGLTGCFRVPAGTGAKSSNGAVETNAITYYCATGGLIVPATAL